MVNTEYRNKNNQPDRFSIRLFLRVTHFGETSEYYKDFVDAVKSSKLFAEWIDKQVVKEGTTALQEADYLRRLKDRYRRHGVTLTNTEAHREMIANFVGDTLFNENGVGLDGLVNGMNAADRNAVMRFLTKIADFFRKHFTKKGERAYLEHFFSQLQNTATGEIGEDTYSIPESEEQPNGYTYNELISKPDMKVTEVDPTVTYSRADTITKAKENARKVGHKGKNAEVMVYVDDIGTDVVVSTDGLKHGLRRAKEGVNSPIFIVTPKAGEIIKNSVRINELTPENPEAKNAYVLIGAAHDANTLYIVRSIVNKFSNDLVSMDVLYAINAKKEESAAPKAPRFGSNSSSVTDSTITISQLLDYVNKYFPDVLPESVLRHYGYKARPDGELGKSALYSIPESDEDLAREWVEKGKEFGTFDPGEKNTTGIMTPQQVDDKTRVERAVRTILGDGTLSDEYIYELGKETLLALAWDDVEVKNDLFFKYNIIQNYMEKPGRVC